MINKKNLCLFFIIITVLFITLPFINKAAHIDDIYVLYGKEQVLKDPFNPYGFQMDFISGRKDFFVYTDPPLMFYYLALATLILGKSLALLHFSTVVFPVIAAISMFFLAKKFTNNNLYAALILVATPTFMTMSHNFMQDAPLASLFLLALTFFIYGIDKGDNILLLIGSFFAGLAYLMKYNGLLLLPLFIIYALLKKQPKKLIYLSVPIMFILLWNWYTFLLYGHSHMLAILKLWIYSAKGISLGIFGILSKIAPLFIAELSMIGGATLFPLMFLFPFARKKSNLISYFVCFMLPIPMMLFLYSISKNFISGRYTLIQLFSLNFYMSLSLFFIYITFRYFTTFKKLNLNIFHNKSNEIFLLTWFFIVFISNFTIVGGSARYNILLIPSLILILFIAAENSKLLKKTQLTLYYRTGFLLTIVLGFSVSIADYQYANVYRDFSNTLSQYKTANNSIWFSGHSGFAYYMQKNGYRMLSSGNTDLPEKGDIIIKARLPSPRPINQKLIEKITLIKTESVKSKFPVRVENTYAHAGFYTYGSGFLPYHFSNSSLEDFEIYIAAK